MRRYYRYYPFPQTFRDDNTLMMTMRQNHDRQFKRILN
jgi:hypothetical protein